MDFNGNPSDGDSLANGGTVNGDLAITQDLTVSGDATFKDFTAENGTVTGTLQVNTLISDITTEDPIIHLAKNNAGDSINTGYFAEYNDGSLKFAGILRSKDDKQFYIIKDITPQPSGITDITSLTRGDLVCNDITSNAVTSGLLTVDDIKLQDTITITNGVREYKFDILPSNRLRLSNNGPSNATYIEFLASKIFQRQSFNSNEGVRNFIQASRGDLDTPTALLANDGILGVYAQGYDGVDFLNSSYIIHYADENFTPTARGGRIDFFTVTNGTVTAVNRFTINDTVQIKNCDLDVNENINLSGDIKKTIDTFAGIGAFRFNPTAITAGELCYFGTSGGLITNSSITTNGSSITMPVGTLTTKNIDISGNIVFKNAGVPRWTQEFDSINDTVAFLQNAGSPVLTMSQDGVVTFGNTPTNYKFPPQRGTDGQYLKSDANGILTWQSFETASFAEQYFLSNATPTLLGTIGQYENILGTRLTGNIQNFTSQALTLTYTGVPTNNFLLNVSLEWLANGNNSNNYQIGFFKNNVLVTEGQMIGKLDNNVANYPRNVSTIAIVPLATNDTVTVKVRNNDSTQGVIVSALSFVVTSINGGGVAGAGGGGSTLQDAYLLSSVPQVITNGTQGALTVKHSGQVTDQVLVIQNNAGTPTIELNENGQVHCTGILNTGLQQSGSIRNSGLFEQGVFPNEYSLPLDNTTASDGNILKYNGTGELLFANPNITNVLTKLDSTSLINPTANIETVIMGNVSPFPINLVSQGSVIRVNLSGAISISSPGPWVLTLRLKLFDTVIPMVINLQDINIVSLPYRADFVMTVRTAGAVGTAYCIGSFEYMNGTSQRYIYELGFSTIDFTSTSLNLAVSAQFDGSPAGLSLFTRAGDVTII